MFIPRTLDVHRLASVTRKIETGQWTDRGEGRTTAYLYLMAAEIELGDSTNRYLYVGENEIATQMAARSFAELVEQIHPDMFKSRELTDKFDFEFANKLKDDWTPSLFILPHGQVFHFQSSQRFCDPQSWRGMRFNRVFFDVSGAQQVFLDTKSSALMDAMTVLQEQGADFV